MPPLPRQSESIQSAARSRTRYRRRQLLGLTHQLPNWRPPRPRHGTAITCRDDRRLVESDVKPGRLPQRHQHGQLQRQRFADYFRAELRQPDHQYRRHQNTCWNSDRKRQRDLTPASGTLQVVSIGKEKTAPPNAVFYSKGGDASNPYNWLTAQLVNLRQNISAGFVQLTDLVYAGSLTPYNAPGVDGGGFTTINNLITLTNQAIVQYAAPANRTPAFLSYLNAIAQALQAANNNTSFVQ